MKNELLSKLIPKNGNVKLVLMRSIPYVLVGYVFNKMSWQYRRTEGATPLGKLVDSLNEFMKAFINPLPSFQARDLMIGILAALVLWLLVLNKRANMKQFRKGIEYGSARWGTQKEIEPFMDSDFSNNIILTKTERLRLNGRPPKVEHDRNKNVLVIGATGTGKTRFVVKPQLMQMNCSYVVTDPKGQVAVECGKMLLDNGYNVKILNLIDFAKSMKYNPFHYIHSEEDILTFVKTLITNTKVEGAQNGESFWLQAETLYFTALVAYIWYEAPEEEKNFITLLEMLDASEVREEDEEFKNAVDRLFDALEERDPEHMAVRQYRKYKLAAGKTAKSILISCAARMAPFDISGLRELTSVDEMGLDKLGDEKSALFVVTSDTNPTFNFIAAIMYSQLFNLLCTKADNVYDGRLPIHVRCLLDEFANLGEIPNFKNLTTTIRSRGISVTIILQSKSQLTTIYKDAAGTIIGNCDSKIFLGGSEASTLKDLEEELGKETIDYITSSDTKGSSSSSGVSYQKTGRSLMSKDELMVLEGGKCILQLRGVRPFKSDKYDITLHPQYRNLADFDKRNKLNLEQYVKNYGLARLRKNEPVAFVLDAGIIDAE